MFNKIFPAFKLVFLFYTISIFKYKKKEKKKEKIITNTIPTIPIPTPIPIAFAIDNKYTYPLIVLLTSILYNSMPTTLYNFNIMVPYDFMEENKQKINGICKKYHNCQIIFHNLGQKYQDWETNFDYYPVTVYYRLSLPDIIKDIDKIIYLDIDTMVHKDLTEFYNIDMKEYYFMGFPGHEIGYTEINGTRNFINSGVILMNLKLLRKINAPKLFDDYYHTYGTKKVDEYLINVLFYNKISFLPFKYGIPDFEKGRDIADSPLYFWNTLNGYCKGTPEEMISGSENRVITHGAYVVEKWWTRNYESLSNIGKKWIFYASKSNVFKEICDYYSQYQTVCENLKKSNHT